MIELIIIALIQGITEWLPISSSAQLIMFMTAVMKLNLAQAMQLTIFIHTGTVMAAIVYFWKDIVKIIKELPVQIKQKNSLFYFLLISTLITGTIGFFVYRMIKEANFLPEFIFIIAIGIFLIITGIIQMLSKNKQTRNIKKIRIKDAIILGILQSFSIIPGISRSGITTSTLLFRKFDSHAALKLSFLMSIPVIIGAEIGMNLTEKILFAPSTIIIAILMTFLVGLISIRFLMNFANKVNFSKFCIALGVLAVVVGTVIAVI